MMCSTEVLVVGAGPTGLALACGLRQQGVPVRVLDRAQRPATTSRANILHARGVEVLNRLGALGDLPERSVRAVKMTMHLGTRRLATVQFGEVENAQLSALLISQAEIEAQLRDRLAELGGRWAILVPEGVEAEPLKSLGDHLVTLTPREPWSEVWLVRPDAHLAWRGRAGSQALVHWLDRALLSGKAP